MENDALRCESVSRKLLFLIYSFIGLCIIISADSIYTLADPGGANRYIIGMGIVGIFTILNLICLIIFFSLWIFRLHKDINTLFPDYDIKPSKALRMTLIPVYNAWGLWKMAKELFKKFKLNEINLSWANISLDRLYILSLAIGGIERALTKMTEKEYYIKEFSFNAKLTVEILSGVCSVLNPIVWYIILTLVMKGIAEIHTKSKTGRLFSNGT